MVGGVFECIWGAHLSLCFASSMISSSSTENASSYEWSESSAAYQIDVCNGNAMNYTPKKKKRFASANNDDHTLMVQCDRQGRNGMTQLYEFISGVGSRRSIVWLFNKIQRANGCNDHPHEEGIRDHWLVRPLLLERFHFISTAALFLSLKFNWWWNTFWWTLMAFSQITLSASHSCLLLELLVATRKKRIHELLDP